MSLGVKLVVVFACLELCLLLHALRHSAVTSLADVFSELVRNVPSIAGTALSSYGLSWILSRVTASAIESILPEGETLSDILPPAALSPVPRAIAYPCLVYFMRLLGQMRG